MPVWPIPAEELIDTAEKVQRDDSWWSCKWVSHCFFSHDGWTNVTACDLFFGEWCPHVHHSMFMVFNRLRLTRWFCSFHILYDRGYMHSKSVTCHLYWSYGGTHIISGYLLVRLHLHNSNLFKRKHSCWNGKLSNGACHHLTKLNSQKQVSSI